MKTLMQDYTLLVQGTLNLNKSAGIDKNVIKMIKDGQTSRMLDITTQNPKSVATTCSPGHDCVWYKHGVFGITIH